MIIYTDWNNLYPDYNMNTLHSVGVISPDTVHLYKFSDSMSIDKQEKMRAHIRQHKCTWVRNGHPVIDMIKDNGFARDLEAFNVDGWYKVKHELFIYCIELIRSKLEVFTHLSKTLSQSARASSSPRTHPGSSFLQ